MTRPPWPRASFTKHAVPPFRRISPRGLLLLIAVTSAAARGAPLAGKEKGRAPLAFAAAAAGDYRKGDREVSAVVSFRNVSTEPVYFQFQDSVDGSERGLITSASYLFVDWKPATAKPGEGLPTGGVTFGGRTPPAADERPCAEPPHRYRLDPGQQFGQLVTLENFPAPGFLRTGRVKLTLRLRVRLLDRDFKCTSGSGGVLHQEVAALLDVHDGAPAR